MINLMLNLVNYGQFLLTHTGSSCKYLVLQFAHLPVSFGRYRREKMNHFLEVIKDQIWILAQFYYFYPTILIVDILELNVDS